MQLQAGTLVNLQYPFLGERGLIFIDAITRQPLPQQCLQRFFGVPALCLLAAVVRNGLGKLEYHLIRHFLTTRNCFDDANVGFMFITFYLSLLFET
jgi:hypothetical protein